VMGSGTETALLQLMPSTESKKKGIEKEKCLGPI